MNEELSAIIGSVESLMVEFVENQQPRSDFVLRHFVAGQHDLPGRQRAQVLTELQVKLSSIKRAKIERERILLRADQARKRYETGDAFGQREAVLDIEQAEVDLEELNLAMVGAVRETNTLLGIFSTMPRYTREQLEAEEAEYWGRRLTRQYVVGGRDVGGNLDAVLQMMTEPGKPKPQVLGTIDEVKGLLGVEG
jgi:hypothetical protein